MKAVDKEASDVGQSCVRCQAPLESTDQFCRRCGLELRPDAQVIGALVERILPERIDAALRRRVVEQKVVEVETAELLADRAIKWLRTLGFFLGIPVVLTVGVLSFVGVKTWSDLRVVAEQTAELQKKLTEPKQQLVLATQQIAQLQADLDAAKQSLSGEISQVGKRQDTLEDQLKAIRGRLGFCPGGGGGSAALRDKLEDALSHYILWLQGVGFDKLDDHVCVFIYSKEFPVGDNTSISSTDPNSFYMNNTLYIHKDMSNDISVALREYSHHALTKAIEPDIRQQTEVESALADYLVASSLDSPIIGANLGGLFGLKTPYIRTLDNAMTYKTAPGDDWYGRGQVLAGALWACRKEGQKQLDKLIRPAWVAANQSGGSSQDVAKRFDAELATAPAPIGPCITEQIAKRGLPH